MGRVHVPAPLTLDRKRDLQKIIREVTWKTASSARYKDAPHAYIICFRSGPEWKVFADAIRDCGEYRTWHGYRYKYLQIDSFVYWVDFPALNRAKADTLDA